MPVIALIVASVIAAGVYAAVSLVPHAFFTTRADDLGIFNQAVYQYAHGYLGPNTVRLMPTLLGDHFEIVMLLLAPLYYLFGSYTLLVIQIASVIFGGVGVYRLVNAETGDRWLAVGAATILYAFYGTYTAVQFDYHNDVVGVMLLPWLLLYFLQRRWHPYYFFLALLLLAKENMPLLAAAVGFYLLVGGKWSDRKHGLITIGVSLLYFLVVLKLLIPALSGTEYSHWLYLGLGADPLAALINILTHPIHAVSLWFNQPDKLVTWKLLILSGGILAFLRPAYALLLLPVLAQKFFADTPPYWGYSFHYSVALAPLAALSVGYIAAKTKGYLRYVIVSFLLFSNLYITFQLIPKAPPIHRIFKAEYYLNESISHTAFAEAKRRIPANAVLSAQSTLIPHLESFRNLYKFPNQRNEGDYILLNARNASGFPWRQEVYQAKEILRLRQSESFQIVYEQDGIILWRRTAPADLPECVGCPLNQPDSEVTDPPLP